MIMFLFWALTAIASVNLLVILASFKKERLPPLTRFPDVTIICRTWDDDHIIERFLKGCLEQDYAGKIQVIIADDASRDRTPEIMGEYVKKYKGRIEYVRAEKHHKWKALFLNPIIKERATGEILFNTDIDAVLPKNWVSECVKSLQKYDAVATPCIGGNTKGLIAKDRIMEDLWIYDTGVSGRKNLTGDSMMFGGSHALWMRVLKEIGYYGTKTITEDVELTLMLNKGNYKVGFNSKPIVLLEVVENLSHHFNERKRWLEGPVKAAKEYKNVLSLYNVLMLINCLLSTTALISIISSFFSPIFLIPFSISLMILVISLAKFRAKLYVYSWIPIYFLLDPLLQIIAIVGVIMDNILYKEVKWVKVSGKKYHLGMELKPVFNK